MNTVAPHAAYGFCEFVKKGGGAQLKARIAVTLVLIMANKASDNSKNENTVLNKMQHRRSIQQIRKCQSYESTDNIGSSACFMK